MDNKIDSFVSSFKAQLERRLGPYEARLIAEEVEAHLKDRALAYQELGSSPVEAETEALRVFGSDRALAREFRQSQPYTLGPIAGNMAHLLAFAAVVANINTAPGPYWLGAGAIAALLAIPAFCRRFPWISFAVWMAVTTSAMVLQPEGTVALTLAWNLPVAIAIVTGPYFIGLATRRLLSHVRSLPRGPLNRA